MKINIESTKNSLNDQLLTAFREETSMVNWPGDTWPYDPYQLPYTNPNDFDINRLINTDFTPLNIQALWEMNANTLLNATVINTVMEDNVCTMWIDVPGVLPDNLSVSLEQNLITVTGKRVKRVTQKVMQDGSDNLEVSVAKTFEVPKGYDVKSLEAEMDLGVLTLTLKKLAEAEVKQIAVKVVGSK